MSLCNQNDSFDSELASLEIPSEPKKQKLTSDKQTASISSKSPQKKAGSYQNSIAVHPKQRGNPLLKSITNVPWEFDDEIVPDYVVGKTACVLFLSLKYHNLNPDYIHNRLKQLGKRFELRVLLVQIDNKVSVNSSGK